MGDSGWAYFEIDGQQEDNEYTEKLIDAIYDTLDYGSWAGEFQAQGEAIYSLEDKAFVGTDYYTEDDTIDWEVNAEIRIPKRIWFDNFLFSIDGYESPEADFKFFVKNGFMTKEHDDILEEQESKMNLVIDQAVEEFEKEHEFRSIYESTTVDRSEFEEDGDDLVYKVTTLDMGTTKGHDNEIYLDVKEIDEQFKEKE